ncbi:hypothetical protein PRIC1_006412 [Phytophthora ramorum]
MGTWKLLCCLASCITLVTASAKQPTLPTAQCVTKVPTAPDSQGIESISFNCQLAALGAYLPKESEDVKVVLAPGGEMLACSPFVAMRDREVDLDGAAVVVRRGECSFLEKLTHVAATGAALMILVNSEEALIALSSLEYERSTTASVSVTLSDGERLIQLVKDSQRQQVASTGTLTAIRLRVSPPVGLVGQARERLQFLVDINAPVAVYEEYLDAAEQLEPLVGTLDELLAGILTEGFNQQYDDTKLAELVEFFSWCARQLSKWGFASQAALHASVAAAVLQLQLLANDAKASTGEEQRVIQAATRKLTECGYYSHSAFLLQRLVETSQGRAGKSVQCQLSFLQFLQGDLVESLSLATTCAPSELGDNGQSLQVAQDAFLRLARRMRSDHDHECLEVAAGSINDTNLALACCYLVGNAVESPSREFSSKFTKELFDTLVMMGVFLDELGPFDEFLRFFSYASRLCEADRTTLEVRQLLAVPVVFSSRNDMDMFVSELTTKLHTFTETHKRNQRLEERVISPLGNANTAAFSEPRSTLRPEAAAYLRYTITPPTMFIGYQGINVLPIQRAVNELRSTVYPSLSSSFNPKPVRSSPSGAPKLRRVGFISTWFRVHSVGKLLLSVIENLDRAKFHVAIYRCMHFLRDSDEITQGFKRTADDYVELPESQDAAVQILRQAQLDVAVFPELGMDEWTVLLSHHRVAPIQCVFWGHPITTGNPQIDYFISSEHFVSKHFDEPVEEPNILNQLSGYRRASFSEQIVLFRGLSTAFTEPKPLTAESKDISRSRLHLPPNRRLYVCPQTLMKLHPAFDEALAGVLELDDKATIVLLASDTQVVWMEKLRRRFRKRFGRAHRRVLFLPTLPFPEFQALLSLADVLLDPFPFGGGVTTLDALHLGIPVVTLPAAQSVVHLAAGFLRYMNASDCIADSLDEYIQLAVNIATDHEDIRQRLLAHRSDLYQDRSTIEDWNTFLGGVTRREKHMTSPP